MWPTRQTSSSGSADAEQINAELMVGLRRVGSFFVGGRRITVAGRASRSVQYSHNVVTQYDPNGSYHIEQAYVQYFLQERPRYRTPLLLVHGGGLTGAQWDDTPDGRPGWLWRFLEAGIDIYVLDNVERGRAGWCAIDGEWPDTPVMRSDEEAARFYRFSFPGHQFPIEAMDGLSAQSVPRWPSTYPLQVEAVVKAIERIGDVSVLGFSQGGGLAFHAADAHRTRVKACIGIEPHGVPSRFEPVIPRIPSLMVFGDFIEDDDYWRDMARRGRAALDEWSRAGGLAEFCNLPELGIRGNTHMMMMDRNSDEIASLLIRYLDRWHGQGAFR
jgi:pimeloyl-ACP methyl ester carboxylesterase